MKQTVRVFFRFTGLLVATLLVTGCGGSSGEKSDSETLAGGTESAGPEVLTLTQQQVNMGGIGFGLIGKRVLSHDIRAQGKVVLPPENDAMIGPQIDGTVASIAVQGGEWVKRGEVLATLASTYILEIQQTYISVRSERQFLKQAFERQAELRRDNINAEKSLEEARYRLADIDARYYSLRMQMEMLHFPLEKLDSGVISPMMDILSMVDGQVEQVFITTGEYVESNEPMFRVINKGNLYLELRVFEKDIPFVAVGQRVTFSLANLGDQLFEARVVSIGQILEEDARTLLVTVSFRNRSPHILPGMFVSATIHTGEEIVDALPEEAVVEDPEVGFIVYYSLSADADSLLHFYTLPVKKGYAEEDFLQVTLGDSLPPGARIVTSGTYYLKAMREE